MASRDPAVFPQRCCFAALSSYILELVNILGFTQNLSVLGLDKRFGWIRGTQTNSFLDIRRKLTPRGSYTLDMLRETPTRVIKYPVVRWTEQRMFSVCNSTKINNTWRFKDKFLMRYGTSEMRPKSCPPRLELHCLTLRKPISVKSFDVLSRGLLAFVMCFHCN